MKLKALVVARVLIGVMLLTFFGMFISGWTPPDVPPRAAAYRDALLDAGFIFPAIYIVYLAVGLSYVTGLFVPLTTIVLFPVTLNIVFYHAFLVPESVALTLVLVIPNLFMIYVCRQSYAPLFRPRMRGPTNI